MQAQMRALRKQLEAAKLAARDRGDEWDVDDNDGGVAAAQRPTVDGDAVLLTLCVMELLSKARLIYHLFDKL